MVGETWVDYGLAWNSMDFNDTLLTCKMIKAYLTAYGYGWERDKPSAQK